MGLAESYGTTDRSGDRQDGSYIETDRTEQKKGRRERQSDRQLTMKDERTGCMARDKQKGSHEGMAAGSR